MNAAETLVCSKTEKPVTGNISERSHGKIHFVPLQLPSSGLAVCCFRHQMAPNTRFNITTLLLQNLLKLCFLLAKRSVTPTSGAGSSCVHFVTKNVVFGS